MTDPNTPQPRVSAWHPANDWPEGSPHQTFWLFALPAYEQMDRLVVARINRALDAVLEEIRQEVSW